MGCLPGASYREYFSTSSLALNVRQSLRQLRDIHHHLLDDQKRSLRPSQGQPLSETAAIASPYFTVRSRLIDITTSTCSDFPGTRKVALPPT